jgi:pSer/pThr/pTyr-binding forkhead associated (FHA) protein
MQAPIQAPVLAAPIQQPFVPPAPQQVQQPAIQQVAPQPAAVPAFAPMPAPMPAPVPSSGVAATVGAVAPDNAIARLVTILKDGSEGQTYRLSGASTDVGRTEGNILLADDPYVSPRHARISCRDGQYFLKDLGSVNGIFYKIREPVILATNDVVLLGQQVLRVEILSEHETSFGPVAHYGVMLFGTPEQPRIARLVQLTTEGVPRDVYHLFREETVVGRESGDLVFTDDAFLSRRHSTFRVDRANRRVVLTDLGSSNGTLVQFRGERELRAGDVFRLGHHLFRVDLPATTRAGGVGIR